MKIVTILGTRPQFIKAAAISREIAKHSNLKEVIIDTGQHFDENMSKVFIKELTIPQPKYCLNVNNLTHGAMTAKMLEKIEDILIKEKPDLVLVYGDTNSTLAGALAAKKLCIKLAHIEAGLRSFNIEMPEEINRVLTDRISDFLFCPTEVAVRNLENEGFRGLKCKIIKSGDVMKDIALFSDEYAKKPGFDIPKRFILATVHRAGNTDGTQKIKSIFDALNKISQEVDVVMPIHPRTRKSLLKNKIKTNFMLVDPLGYLEMIYLLKKCKLVITDSGGLQKEAFLFKKPSVVLRDKTEWIELIEGGFAALAGSETDKILQTYNEVLNKDLNFDINLYGDAKASEIIVRELLR